jgi:hypothetical protein
VRSTPFFSQRRAEVVMRCLRLSGGPKRFRTLRQGDVFHERDLGKAAGGGVQGARYEDALVAGGYARPAGAQVHGPFDYAQERVGAGDAHVEPSPAPARAGEPVHDQRVGLRRRDAVRVQKEQDGAGRARGAGVHSAGPPAWGRDHEIRPGDGRGPPCHPCLPPSTTITCRATTPAAARAIRGYRRWFQLR